MDQPLQSGQLLVRIWAGRETRFNQNSAEVSEEEAKELEAWSLIGIAREGHIKNHRKR
jgi:hypothetical protein